MSFKEMHLQGIKSGRAYFYDKNGDERGGIAITNNETTNLNALALDYQNADTVVFSLWIIKRIIILKSV